MEKIFDIAVVGAGPSGLTAAIKAKELAPCANVALIEKMQDAAKKLSASGNGRGNLSNRNCDSCDRVLEFFFTDRNSSQNRRRRADISLLGRSKGCLGFSRKKSGEAWDRDVFEYQSMRCGSSPRRAWRLPHFRL